MVACEIFVGILAGTFSMLTSGIKVSRSRGPTGSGVKGFKTDISS